MFQLRKRLERLKSSQSSESFPHSAELSSAPVLDEDREVDEQGACEGKLSEGNVRLRARFG